MINIFEKLHTLTESLNNPNKNYWDNNEVVWDKAAKAPNGDTFNEQQMYESIRESDMDRC